MLRLKEIEVWNGTQASPGSKYSFGGWTSYYDEEGRAVFVVAVGVRGGEEWEVELREGDTFTVGDHIWRATEIVAPGSMGAHVTLKLVERDQSDAAESSTAHKDDSPPWASQAP